MTIKSENRDLYPANWPEFHAHILARADRQFAPRRDSAPVGACQCDSEPSSRTNNRGASNSPRQQVA